MIFYFLKRLLFAIPVMCVVVTLVFFLLRLIPGDPVDFILGEAAPQADRLALVSSQGFDEPVLKQYFHFLQAVFKGDLGQSFFTRQSVGDLIGERYPQTVKLALIAMVWAILFSIPAGVFASVLRGKIFDRVLLASSLVGISVPSFYLGPLLVLLFSIKLDWFPASGQDLPGSIILPSLTLGLAMAAILTRMTRSSMLDILNSDYVRTARAKGLSFFKVVFKHALGNALIPIVSLIALQFGTLLAGAIVTEKIFSWPGLGSLLLESIGRRDYAVVQGCLMVIALAYVVVNLMADLILTKIDPRIRLK